MSKNGLKTRPPDVMKLQVSEENMKEFVSKHNKLSWEQYSFYQFKISHEAETHFLFQHDITLRLILFHTSMSIFPPFVFLTLTLTRPPFFLPHRARQKSLKSSFTFCRIRFELESKSSKFNTVLKRILFFDSSFSRYAMESVSVRVKRDQGGM